MTRRTSAGICISKQAWMVILLKLVERQSSGDRPVSSWATAGLVLSERVRTEGAVSEFQAKRSLMVEFLGRYDYQRDW